MSRTNLTLKELYKLSSSAADLYRTTNRSTLAHKIAKLAGNSLAIDHSGTWEVDSKTLEERAAFSNSDSEEMAKKSWPVFTHFAKRYPWLVSHLTDPRYKGKVFDVSEIVPHSVVEPIGLIDEYARPNFCEFQLIFYFRQHGPRTAFLTCSRGERPYTAREKEIIAFLAPHFQAAYENSGAFEDKSAAIDRAEALQQTLNIDCLWINHEFKVKEATPRISGLIREFLVEKFSGSELPERILAWARACLPPGATGEAITPLVIDRESASLKIRLYPDRLPGLHLLTLSRRVTVPTTEHLKPLGLTRRESEILLWVAQAKTNDEIARLLGCSSRTVAKHMEHLLLKLKVENRSAAMLLVADLLQN